MMHKFLQKIRQHKLLTIFICLVLVFSYFYLTMPISMENKEIKPSISNYYELPKNYLEHRSQQQFFETPDGKIAYTDHGQGEVIVLIHGVPTSSWMYRHIIPKLQENFRVISIDLLGFGSSDKPREMSVFEPQKQANRVFDLLDSLGIDSWTQVFHDMGGLVTWEMLAQNSVKIKNLVFLNTIIEQGNFNPPFLFPRNALSKIPLMMYEKKLGGEIMIKSTFINGMKESSLSKEAFYGYVYPMREGAGMAIYQFFTQFNDDFFVHLQENKSLLQNFSGDTLVLWGGTDKILSSKQIPFIQKYGKVLDKNIHIFPEADHFLLEQIPDKITEKILEFLK